jgi:hypothetical protein
MAWKLPAVTNPLAFVAAELTIDIKGFIVHAPVANVIKNYGRNYVAIDVNQSKSQRNMPLVV